MREILERLRALRTPPPELPRGAGLHQVRKLVADALEFPLAHTCMNTEFSLREMTEYYVEAREAALARARLLADLGEEKFYTWTPGEEAHALWHAPGEAFAGSTPVYMPESAVVGGTSAVKAAQLHVVLWTYQQIASVPDGFEVRDARDLLPADEAAILLAIPGFRIAHLADVVRLKAMAASSCPSWFIDLDVLWMASPAMWVDKLPQQAAGHFFGSTLLAPGRRSTTAVEYERLVALHPLVRSRDALVLCPPFRCPPGSPFPAKSFGLGRTQCSPHCW